MKNVFHRTLWTLNTPDYSASELQERFHELNFDILEGKLDTRYLSD